MSMMTAETGLVRPVDCTPVELLPVISMDAVAEHDHEDDCWVIFYDLVYDLTDFIREVRVSPKR
jgi:cytochrome b involved in lipid metabolism